jgi:hypothetical protein
MGGYVSRVPLTDEMKLFVADFSVGWTEWVLTDGAVFEILFTDCVAA